MCESCARPFPVLIAVLRPAYMHVEPVHSSRSVLHADPRCPLQTLTLFAALSHGRVYLVLAWTALAPHLQALQLRRLSAGAIHGCDTLL